jgi:hypothetical protein
VIAALFVQTGGVYFGLPDVDPWDERRDARLYDGPYAVVAHPPCQRWGKFYWRGKRGARAVLGQDEGCFAAALLAVMKWGGVLEHPLGSLAWPAFGLRRPPTEGGWVLAGDHLGWTCCVYQGHYGHRAPKASLLYAVGVKLPELIWGPSKAKGRIEMMSSRGGVRSATPIQFRDILLAMARSSTERDE